jgi:hypothetical protein
MHCYPLFWKQQKKEKGFPQRKRSLLNVKTHFFPFPFPSAPFCYCSRSTRVAGIIHFFACRLGRDSQPIPAARKGRLSRLATERGWLFTRCVASYFAPSSLGWENLCGWGSTSTATDGATGTAATSPLAEATTTTTAAVEVAAATLAATLLEATTALELLLAVTGTGVAALLDPELFLANLEGAGGDGGLVALGGLEVDESAVLLMLLVK